MSLTEKKSIKIENRKKIKGSKFRISYTVTKKAVKYKSGMFYQWEKSKGISELLIQILE